MSSRNDSDMSPLARFGRMVIPWVGLIIVVTLTWSFIGQYRNAASPGDGETTGTPDATATAEASNGDDTGDSTAEPAAPDTATTYVLVLAEGLNLRSRPMTSATVVKQLKKDTRLTLLEKGSGWYRVRDPEGVEGWVAAGGNYTQLVEP